MDTHSRRVLDCVMEQESFNDIVALTAITPSKSENPAAQKHEQKQWRKASERHVMLRDW